MTKEINGVEYTINEKIENFSIKSMPSSNVAFYGVGHDLGNKQMFVQFKNGSSYIYSGITDEAIIGLINCESIGKYVSSQIVGKFPTSGKLEEVLVMPIIESQILGRINRNSQPIEVSSIEVNKDGDLTEPTF